MQPLNFLLIFAVVLGLVFFSLQNPDPVVVALTADLEVSAPLCMVLIVSMGVGAFLAWVFSTLASLQRLLSQRREQQIRRRQEAQIRELQQQLQDYQLQLEDRLRLPPAGLAPGLTPDATDLATPSESS